MDTIYKVTFKNSTTGLLVSTGVIGTAKVTYTIGAFSKAPVWLATKGYHLFAYKNIIGAYKEFLHGYYNEEDFTIWEAQGRGRITPVPPMLQSYYISKGLFEGVAEVDSTLHPMEDIVMYKEIKLVHMVPWGYARELLEEEHWRKHDEAH